jgi:hypothetical protein
LSEKAIGAMRQDLQGVEENYSRPAAASVAVVPTKATTAVAQGTEVGM